MVVGTKDKYFVSTFSGMCVFPLARSRKGHQTKNGSSLPDPKPTMLPIAKNNRFDIRGSHPKIPSIEHDDNLHATDKLFTVKGTRTSCMCCRTECSWSNNSLSNPGRGPFLKRLGMNLVTI